MRKTLLSSLLLTGFLAVHGQETSLCPSSFFQHLDVGVSAGTTGFGIDLATPLGPWLDIRAGFSLMPQFKKHTSFDVQVGEIKEKKYDEQGHRIETKFDRMAAMLKSLTGFQVRDNVGMYCVPTYHNAKLIFDVKPFADKRWYVSAGVFYGNSTVARAYNDTKAMTTLLAVGMYNRIHTSVSNEEPIVDYSNADGSVHINFELPPQYNEIILKNGRMAMGVGQWTHDVFYEEDVYSSDGRDLLHHAGDLKYAKGSPYLMEPGSDSMVKVTMKANRVKPYIGGGFHDTFGKDDAWQWSADAGVLFWGGVPHMVTHEGVCLIHDVEKVSGKPGRYIKTAKMLPVFPLLEIRLIRRFSLH